MGTKLKDIIIRKEVSFEDLQHKKVVVDSFNILYQFLTSIRQRDGSFLTDSQGRITSHLTGLFSRTIRMIECDIKPAFVFDGKPPALKMRERERRAAIKEEAELKYKEALAAENVEDMKKYAVRTTRLTKEMIEEAKELIEAMGFPIIQAPSEGEAQAAHIVKNGDAYAEVSQDYDCLMFGVKRVIQNLTVSEKRKVANKLAYETVKPQIIDLEENLKNLGITNDQLIVVGMLVGTDYNIGGIKGIGPKNALKLVKQHGSDFDALFKQVEWEKSFDFSWKEVFDLIKHMPVTDDYKLVWKNPNKEKIIEILCDKHEFNRARIESALEKLEAEKKKLSQRGLDGWF